MSGQQVVHILSATTILPFSFFFRNILSKYLPPNRVADVGTVQPVVLERAGSSTKGRTPNIRFCCETLVLSRFMRFLKGFRRASTKVILFMKRFQRKSSCFRRGFNKSFEALFCGRRKTANPCQINLTLFQWHLAVINCISLH